MDPLMPYLVGGAALILLIGLAFRALRQPYVVGYLLAGVAMGPSGLGLVTDHLAIARAGEIGVILLLFFVGMEVSLPHLVARWKVPVLGTLLQIALSVGCIVGLGSWRNWPMGRSILLGLVISLSSTAVVIKLLQSRDELKSPIGQDVVGVLLMQDLAIVPMLVVVGLLGGEAPSGGLLALQVVGGVGVVGLLVYVATQQTLHLPLGKIVKGDGELQVFAAGLLCFGLALATGLLGLSAALGAFIGGVVVGASRDTDWIHGSLFPFYVILLALFFVSVGLLIDLDFIFENALTLTFLVIAAFLINTIFNTLILRALGRTWRDGLYGGALLSQIGEFSFVLAAIGLQGGLIGYYGYQMTIAVIALTMTLSPVWLAICARIGRAVTVEQPSS